LGALRRAVRLMRKTTTLLLLLITAVVSYFALRTKHAGPPLPPGAAAHLFDFKPDEADHITLSGKNLNLSMEKRDGLWWITEPIKDRANLDSVNVLLKYLTLMTSVETINHDVLGKEGWKRAGLNGSAIVLEIAHGKQALATCRVGAHTPLEETIYLTLPKRDPENLARVVRIPLPHEAPKPDFAPPSPPKAAPQKDLVTLVQNSITDWRDPLLLRVPMDSVKRMTLSAGTGVMEFKRKSSHRGDAPTEAAGAAREHPWMLVKPLNARASEGRVDAVLREILRFEARPAVQEKAPDAATTALPMMRVSLDVQGSPEPVELSLQPAATGSAEILATLSNRPGVFSLPARAAEIWKLQPNDLRDPNLAYINDATDAIHIRSLADPEIVLNKRGRTWMLKRFGALAPANQDRVLTLISQMNAAQIREFTTDAPTSLDPYGLSVPFMELEWSGPNDKEPNILSFGQAPEGGPVYAKYKSEPFVYRISPILLTKIPTEIQKWQGLMVLRFATQVTHRIVIAEGTAPPTTLFYDANGKWSGALAGRDVTARIDYVRADALLDLLANFNAETWVIDRTPGYEALKNPTLTVQLLLGDPGNPDAPPKPRTLIFAPNSTGTTGVVSYYGRLDANPDLFLISRETYQALTASVLTPSISAR
jgi:hypothetical protein